MTFSDFVRAFEKNNKPPKRKASPELRAKLSESARLSWRRRRDWVNGAEARRQAQIEWARQFMEAIEANNERIRQRDRAREKQ